MTKKKYEEGIYDLRTVQFQIDRGNLKRSEFEKFLKSLPDDESNYDIVKIDDDVANEEGTEANSAE